MWVRRSSKPILKEGRNFWRKDLAHKVGYVVDASNFFRAFYEAALRAERQLFIVGWDTDSRVDLLVEEDHPVAPKRLKEFLISLLEQKPELEIYVLSWDFNIFFSFEREAFPHLKFEWNSHPRLHYHLDSFHPPLGSHHQKIVVVDDQLAFSGGLDITARRWDTSEHKGRDSRRVDPWGKSYGPFHDVQIAVQGPAAKILGDLARERWRLATDEVVSPPARPEDYVIWPESLAVDISSIEVAVSRTVPAMQGVEHSREVERLFTDSIYAAKKFIYFEAQYFSSKSVARALARRLQEPNGPEVVMVLARDATGWIEESTMSVLRQRVLELIRRVDKYNRFRIYHPVVPGLDDGYVKVHSKVTVVDDRFCRIGSANLNQRSMGLDTECDISFEAKSESEVEAIASLRSRLLAEHLDVDRLEFEKKFNELGSLIDAVEFFRGRPRTLVELEREIPAWLDMVVPGSEVIDPSSPYRLTRAVRRYFPNFASVASGRVHWLGRFKLVPLALILIALVLAWKFTPLSGLVEPKKLSAFLGMLRAHPLGYLFIILAFVLGGLVMVPVTALILATALTFEPLTAFILIVIGSASSAMVTYWIGGKFKSDYINRLTNTWLKKIKGKLAAGGWLAVAIIRLIPVAPFTVINLVAGSIKIPFRDFAIGTAVGLLPGILAFTLLANRLGQLIRAPTLSNFLWLALIILMFIAATRLFKYLAAGRVR
jgi:phospholipase D1/2